MSVVWASPGNLWWPAAIVPILAVLVWRRSYLQMSPPGVAGLAFLLLAFLNPTVLLSRSMSDHLDLNAEVRPPRVLLVEYGNGRTLLGTALKGAMDTQVVSPDNLAPVTELLNQFDVVTIHATKNIRVYADYFSDWQTFPTRKRLENMFTDYGVVFDNGTQTLPADLSRYGLVILVGADIKLEEKPRLDNYVKNGGRLLVLLHAAGGVGVNAAGSSNPYCIVFNHPPFGTAPFPEALLQRNVGSWLRTQLDIGPMENISCTYGKVVVENASLSALTNLYGAGQLYPSGTIDGKDFEKIDWTSAFVGYDPAWQPLLRVDTRYAAEPTGHGTQIGSSVDGKAVAVARQYGQGRIYVFGVGPVNYGISGVPASVFLTAAPYMGTDVIFPETTVRGLKDYVASGGNLVVVGPTLPKSTGASDLADLLPVRFSGTQVTETATAVLWVSGNPIVSGLGGFSVDHYRASTNKPGTEILLSDSKNPLMVSSFLGLGTVTYYLPELPDVATLKNTAPPEMWQRLMLWLAPTRINSPEAVGSLALAPGSDLVTLRLWDEEANLVSNATVSCTAAPESNAGTAATLREIAPGTYAGRLNLAPGQKYTVRFNVKWGTTTGTSAIPVEAGRHAAWGIPDALWKLSAWVNGSADSIVTPAPLWQLLVLVGFACLVADWARRAFRGDL